MVCAVGLTMFLWYTDMVNLGMLSILLSYFKNIIISTQIYRDSDDMTAIGIMKNRRMTKKYGIVC